MSFPLDQILLGACEDTLKTLTDCSVDAIITDPPYGLGTKEPTGVEIDAYLAGGNLDVGGDFMGKAWEIPTMTAWREMLRVLKPGAPLMSFAGTRTWDLLDAGAREVGFLPHPEIEGKFGSHILAWCHSQGFPKSRDVFRSDLLPRLEGALRAQGVEGPITWRNKR
jgi:site-specific DNA-methyltransferase (adenine-specific)